MRNRLFFTRRHLFAIFVLTLMAAGQVAAETYRWVDDNGNVVYSQLPPTDGRTSQTLGAPPPPAEPPEQAQQRLNAQIEQLDAQREKRQSSKKAGAERQAREAEQARQCELARHNLEGLQQGSRNRFRNPDGSYSRLTEEQKAKRIQDARSYLEEYCP